MEKTMNCETVTGCIDLFGIGVYRGLLPHIVVLNSLCNFGIGYVPGIDLNIILVIVLI